MSDAYARQEAINHAVNLHRAAGSNTVDAVTVVKDAGVMLAFLSPDQKAPIGHFIEHEQTEPVSVTDLPSAEEEIRTLTDALNLCRSSYDVINAQRVTSEQQVAEQIEKIGSLQREVRAQAADLNEKDETISRLETLNRDKDIVRDTLKTALDERDDLIASLRLDVKMANEQTQNMRGLTQRVQAEPVTPVTQTVQTEPQEDVLAQPQEDVLAEPEPVPGLIPSVTEQAEHIAQPQYSRGREYETGAVIYKTTPFFWQDEDGHAAVQATATRDLMVGGDTPEGLRYFAAVRIG